MINKIKTITEMLYPVKFSCYNPYCRNKLKKALIVRDVLWLICLIVNVIF